MNLTSVPFARLAVVPVILVVATSATWAESVSVPISHESASVLNYAAPDGQEYFALAVKTQPMAPSAADLDHVVLFDTSASQVGVYRDQSLLALRTFLESLRPRDRVSLFAVDVVAKALTDGFVHAGDANLNDALAQLELRVPLGATDMHQAVSTALKQVDRGTTADIVYIGDGMSSANLIATAPMQQLLQDLTERHVPMHSYAVGPQTDLQLLGLLAQFSGGYVTFGADAVKGGRALATAVRSVVFYPRRTLRKPQNVELLPATALPVRSDRETFYLGKGTLESGASVAFTGELAEAATTFQWDIDASKATPFGSMLAVLWQRAERRSGIDVPFAGRSILMAAQREFDNQLDDMANLGKRAFRARNFAEARQLGQAMQTLDPRSVDAKAILAASNRVKFQLAQQSAPAAPDVATDAAPVAPPADATPATVAPRDLISDREQRQKIVTEQMQVEATRTIQEARGIAMDDPDAAVSLLKRLRGLVQASNDVDPEARLKLQKRLENVILDIRTKQETNEQKRIRQQERFAVIEADKRLQDQMRMDDQKLEQLIDRVRALIAEGRRGNDQAYAEAKEVSKAARELHPGSGMTSAAVFDSEAAYQVNNIFNWRNLRAERWLQTLEQVEISHVPFPDEPPVRWPPAPVWKALSERRAKWASVDLHKSSPSEDRIIAALDDQTEMEFIQTPLEDAITYFSELHNIPVIIDKQAMAEDGIPTDEPIDLVLSGIMLKSALKIILEPLGLAYVIEDEVMKITTQTIAEDTLQTRVYPVGDLVIPIQSGGAGFGSLMGGGGMGGMGMMGGGGMGGMGMGGMGMGGMGGFSGGMGGFGGGAFSVSSDPIPQAAPAIDQDQAPAAQSKPQAANDTEVQDAIQSVLSSGSEHTRIAAPAKATRPVQQPFRFDNAAIEALKKKP